MASFLYLMLFVVIAVNFTSALVWLRLIFLVRSADKILSFTTASLYGKFLFGQVMTSKFFRARSAMALGNPERDPVIRKVRGSSQYQTVEFVASLVKDLPLNLVPHMI
ncbi:MAG: hypothetical protein SGJ27_05620 [Candidatus Melainabacteria bacterium]|nr:hypothetical protein [Candidatus Melainabacteria bacterium]